MSPKHRKMEPKAHRSQLEGAPTDQIGTMSPLKPIMMAITLTR